MNDGKLTRVVERLEGRQPRMQTEEPVEIDGRVGTRAWTRYRDARPGAIVRVLAERHDHVQPVDGTALEDRHEYFSARRVGSGSRPGEEGGREAEADEREPAVLEEDASRVHLETYRFWNSGDPSTSAMACGV